MWLEHGRVVDFMCLLFLLFVIGRGVSLNKSENKLEWFLLLC